MVSEERLASLLYEDDGTWHIVCKKELIVIDFLTGSSNIAEDTER
jgi:hypothetical protein